MLYVGERGIMSKAYLENIENLHSTVKIAKNNNTELFSYMSVEAENCVYIIAQTQYNR